jgi:hypothetical protein
MKLELKQALRKMGYRHMGKGVWGKPVAYHLLTVQVEKEKVRFTNYFKGVQDKVLVWESKVLDAEDYEASLKLGEYATRTDVGQPYHSSSFGFLTREEMFADML